MQPIRAADEAATLLAKHRAFVGWQLGDDTFKTLRLNREYVNDEGATTQRVVESRIGLLYRNTYTYLRRANTTENTGFTGNVFWTSNDNGFTTPLYGDLAKWRLSYTVLFNEGVSSLSATTRGTATIGDKVADVVRIDVPHADPIDAYIDPATGAFVKAVIDPDGDEESTIQILSYTNALPGKRIIGSFRLGAGSKGAWTYSNIEANVPISDAELHPPMPSATWTFANPKPFPVSVTPKRVLVDASVNGVRGRFILDTGAQGIFVSQSFADRAGLAKLNVGGNSATLYGPQHYDLRRAASIALGGNTLSNVIVEATNFNGGDYRGLDRENLDGLLGYDIFAGAIVRLDFNAATMSIDDPDSAAADPNGIPILTDTSGWLPTIPMTLNHSLAVNAMLDTGNPAAIVIAPDLLYKYHLRMARDIATVPGYGSIECGNIESLTIGPITYGGEGACKLDSASWSGRNILVGLDFIRHFNFIFDYPHGRLVMIPHKNA